MTKFLLSIVFLFTTAGCDAAVREWQQERLLNHLSQIQNYHGTIVESGILDSKEDLVSEIWFEKPGHYLTLVQSPEKQAGVKMAYDGKTLQIYYPKSKFAILYKNLKPLTEADTKQIIKDQFKSSMDSFHYQLGSASKVAGLPVVELSFISKISNPLINSGTSEVYDDFSFPLAGELHFNNQVKYSYKFKDIQFNDSKAHKEFALSIPEDTIVSEWDMGSKAISEKEARETADFKFQMPKDIPSELKLKKIIRQKGPIPAFTAVFEGHPYFLNVVFFKNYGFSAAPSGRGLKISAGNVIGDLIPNPHVNSYSFIKGDTQYILSGNISAEEIIGVATSIAKDAK